MNKLYLLGGPPRVGKSIIMSGLTLQRQIPSIATDAVQQGVRSLFIDDPHQIIKEISFSGWAEYKRQGTDEVIKQEFLKHDKENNLGREAVVGMIDHYRRNSSDLIIEGVHITPDWVNELDDLGYRVCAVFVGYNSESYADSILKFAKANEHDWVNKLLALNNGDEDYIRKWVTGQVAGNIETAKKAEQYGYKYFDAAAKPFKDYVAEVQNYFLEF